jgi:hypothetical protein
MHCQADCLLEARMMHASDTHNRSIGFALFAAQQAESVQSTKMPDE